MTDDFTEPDPNETRAVLRQVAAYRRVCEQVRRKGTGSLVFGCIMLAIWWMIDGQHPNKRFELFSLLYLGIALLEVGVGLFNRFYPTAEGVLLDAVVLLGFAASNGVRAFLVWQATKTPDPVFTLFALFWVFQGVMLLRSYRGIVRGMKARPTRAQLRWFNDLLNDLRAADPKADRRAVAFPTEPFVSGLLLGESAFFLDGTGEVWIVPREDVTLEAENSPDPDRPPRGYLEIGGSAFPPFALSRANWENYAAWKREGGEEP